MSRSDPPDALLLLAPALIRRDQAMPGWRAFIEAQRRAGVVVAVDDVDRRLRDQLGTPALLARLLEVPGWRVALAGPPGRGADADQVVADLALRFQREPTVRAVLARQLVQRLFVPGAAGDPGGVWEALVAGVVRRACAGGPPGVVRLWVGSREQLGAARDLAAALRTAGCPSVEVVGPQEGPAEAPHHEDGAGRRTRIRRDMEAALRRHRADTGVSPSFWELQETLGEIRGEPPAPPESGVARPLRVLLVRASLPGARRRGVEPPPMDPPLGLLTLASAVKAWSSSEHEVSVVDLGVACDAPGEVLGLVAGHEPDVVGISGNNVDEDQVHLLARTTKLLYPDAAVVVGGPIASARQADLLADPYIDLLVLREGERTLPELLDTLARNGDPVAVRGLLLRGEDGTPRETGERPFIEDLDTIPFPDWDQIDLRDYRVLCNANEFPIQAEVYASIFTSRGCPWRCVFCHNFFGHRARTRSPGNVLDELELLVRDHGVGEIHVHDDMFNVNGDRLEAICDGIVERGLDLKIAFPNGLRADRLTRRHLEKLAAAGCYHMCMALESAVPRLQELMRKHLDVERVLENARIASELGIMPAAFVMIGLPTETREEIRANMEAVVQSHFDQLRLFVACPHPGTEMYDLAVEHGFDPSGFPADQLQYDWERGSVNCTDIPDDEFRGLVQEFQQRFWSHPPRVERLRRAHEERGVTMPHDPRMDGDEQEGTR